MDFDAISEGGKVFGKQAWQAPAEERGLYRGWMLRVDDYQRLFRAASSRGLALMTSPESYRRCHHLPASYEVIEAMSARSIWTTWSPEDPASDLMDALKVFGRGPVIVKEFVKSEKHHWEEACFIPDASDEGHVMGIVERFLELRGDALEGGLVFREFLDLEPVGTHATSATPVFREYRLFFLHQKLIVCTPYWEGQSDEDVDVPLAPFEQVAQRIDSPFFTMDIARQRDGTWVIVELGDGQVAGLPDQLDPVTFYQRLWEALEDEA